MEQRKGYAAKVFHTMGLLLLITITLVNYGCGVAVGLASDQMWHNIGKSIDESKPIVATSYQTDVNTLTALVENEAKTTIENSEVVLKFVKTKNEASSKVIEIRTLKGSVITINIEREDPVEGMSITLLEIYSEIKEDGVLGWTRADVSTGAPFNEIIGKIRSKAKASHIKIVSDTVKQGLIY